MALAGKGGYLRLDGSGFPFKSWRMRFSAVVIDVSTFLSAGFAEIITGLKSAEITAEGLLVPALQVAVGTSYTLALGAGTDSNGISYGVSMTAVCVEVTGSTDVTKSADISAQFRSSGVFTPTFAVAA